MHQYYNSRLVALFYFNEIQRMETSFPCDTGDRVSGTLTRSGDNKTHPGFHFASQRRRSRSLRKMLHLCYRLCGSGPETAPKQD